MHIKSIATAALLSAALGLGGVAVAQDAAATTWPTMIGNQEVGAGDADRVKVYCDDLQTRANQAEGTEPTDGDAAATNDTSSNSTDTTEAATAAVGNIDMDAITIENCLEGGWLEGVTTPE